MVMTMDKTAPPWTAEQVTALDVFQRAGFVHPFTCPNRGDGNHGPELGGCLIPTARGWICQFCDYTQDWAHAFMLKPPTNPWATLRAKTAIEAVAAAWASIDGKLVEYGADRRGDADENAGHYGGYMDDAAELLKRVEARGYVIRMARK